jgi:endo-1,4-beta-xylanase
MTYRPPRPRRHLRDAVIVGVVGVVAAAGALVVMNAARAATTLGAAAEISGRYFGTAIAQGKLGTSAYTTIAAASSTW